MSYPGFFARHTPDKAAVISAETAGRVSYAELNDRSVRLANMLRELGLGRGDSFAVLAENNIRYHELVWAALRSGLYATFANSHLTPEEVAYQVTDSGSKVFISTATMADVARDVAALIDPDIRKFMLDGITDGFASYEEAIAAASAEQPASQPRGEVMLYSSGTTGRPKGIRRPLTGADVENPAMTLFMLVPGADDSIVYLSPAPMYHAAPLRWSTDVHVHGGTVVMMRRFDPEPFLAAIERYRVTHTQVVPTMMIRLLRLPASVRARYDLSSLKVLIHAAAPCPPEVKEAFLDWLGPVVWEYYAGTEGSGLTIISPEDARRHRGSVGQAVIGVPHICDELGNEVPNGTPGTIYFEQPVAPFEYHRDPAKTRMSRHPEHDNWTTIGDVGYLDDEGWLYLTDRRSFMIISGGVNIYPAEIEGRLVLHEKVADVAVFGLPDPEMGEFVQAVVQLAPGVPASAQTEQELRDYAREHLAGFKVPRQIDFRDALPRLETGKLAKYRLRREYLA